jgi:phospholipid/cholesterol/gamma-HCH transport system substrate-binding protein
MRALLKESHAEALVGLLVVLVAVWFTFYAWSRTGGSGAANAIHVKALFPNAAGVAVGTDVRIAGLKIGTVSAQRLDPESYQAELTLALDPSVKVPADSSAAITSEGLLGGTSITMVPGGETVALKDGDTILDTQGATDLMSLVGQFVNRSGGSENAGGGNQAAPEAGATPAP